MKFQISFDLTDLNKALDVTTQIVNEIDILEIGSLLLYKHGTTAIENFRKTFPQTTLLVDAKIVDRGKETITLLSQAGADLITVMSGTRKEIIHSACATAHNLGKKIVLDLLDASSLGQSALEAQSVGADALLFHINYEESKHALFVDQWDIIHGNTSLPIYICGNITKDTIQHIKQVNPFGVVIGNAVVNAENPLQALLEIKG